MQMIVIDIILDIKERETDVPDGEMNILGSNNCHSTSTNSLEGSSGHPRCDENHIHNCAWLDYNAISFVTELGF